jgi:phosphatidylserine/phosphatidylglycerophosphate/cardiolipin synthase-like enzyme
MSFLEPLDVRLVGVAVITLITHHALLAAMRMFHREPATAAHFSPKGGCTTAIVAELNAARSEVLVMAYSFSCPDIAGALAAAAGRRVRVAVLLDRSNEAETYSELGDLARGGVEVWIDASHAIAHNKVMVIDGRTVVTGSFNFTRQAEHENAENLLILRDHPGLAAVYRENFHAHREHCVPPGTRKPPAPHDHSRPHRVAA